MAAAGHVVAELPTHVAGLSSMTQLEETSAGGVGSDWDPFQDHSMLELTGDIALQAGDLDALEAWLEQAAAARLPASKLLPMRQRYQELKEQQEMDKERMTLERRLEIAMATESEDSLREALEEAEEIGIVTQKVRAAKHKLALLKQQQLASLRQQALQEAEAWEKDDPELIRSATAKIRKQRECPDADDTELSAAEKAAFERNHYRVHYPQGNEVLQRAVEDARSKSSSQPKQEDSKQSIEIVFVFSSGATETCSASPEDRSMVLLTELMKFRQKHRVPDDLGLFLESGQALDMWASLQAQGLKGGQRRTVRVDDAVLGAQRTR